MPGGRPGRRSRPGRRRPRARKPSSCPMSRSSAWRQRTAGASSAIGEFEKTMNGPVRIWYCVGTSGLAAVEGGAAGPAQQQQQHPGPPERGRAVASAVRCVASLLDVFASCQDSGRPRRRFRDRLAPHRPLDRPPERLPVVQGREAPGEIEAEEPERVGPGAARDVGQADRQPRQVLDPSPPGQRVPEPDADQVDQAQPILVGRSCRSGSGCWPP